MVGGIDADRESVHGLARPRKPVELRDQLRHPLPELRRLRLRDAGVPDEAPQLPVPETLRKRLRQAEADAGLRPDLPTSEEREEIRLRRSRRFSAPAAGRNQRSAIAVGATADTTTTVTRSENWVSSMIPAFRP